MLRPTRPMPRRGSRVRLVHFGGEVESGTIIAVDEGGRRLQVSCEGGEQVEFVLSEATAKFVAVGWAEGMRLLLD